MNSDEMRGLRALVLHQNAVHFKALGVYEHAKAAAASYPGRDGKQRIGRLLPSLARTVANEQNADPWTIEKRIFLSSLLSALAEGFDVRKELRIDPRKAGHRRSEAALNTAIVHELEQRFAERQAPSEAFAEVAAIAGKPTAGAVRIIWQRAKKNKSRANVRRVRMK